MNIENQAPDPPEPQRPNSADSQTPHSAAPDPFVKPDGPSANSAPQETSLSTWRHNGKVAHLPKTVRDKINLMIQDGVKEHTLGRDRVWDAQSGLPPMEPMKHRKSVTSAQFSPECERSPAQR